MILVSNGDNKKIVAKFKMAAKIQDGGNVCHFLGLYS